MLNERLNDKIELVLSSIEVIGRRMLKIKSAGDFYATNEGTDILDAILMRLLVIGESIKNMELKHQFIFDQHAQIDWSNIIRFRDLVAHHYDAVDAEMIFEICSHHLPLLYEVIKKIQNQLPQ